MLQRKRRFAEDKVSPRFIAGIIGFCILIFVVGVSTGIQYKSCTCPEPKIRTGKAPFEKEIEVIYIDRATTYQATIAQCDSTPFSTASGAKICPWDYQDWIAVSRDLHKRWGGPLEFGDTMQVESEEHPNFNGKWVVQDLMGPDYENSIDFLLESEKNVPKLGIGTDFKIWKI